MVKMVQALSHISESVHCRLVLQKRSSCLNDLLLSVPESSFCHVDMLAVDLCGV